MTTNSDILTSFHERLRDAGLAVEAVQADGLLHRCGTKGRPDGMDGAYKAFADAPASLWWRNWRTGDEGTWSVKTENAMDDAERAAFRQRVDEAKKAATAEQAQRHADAARKAQRLWERATPAETHPYLERKGIHPHGACILGSSLVVPVWDETGKAVQSLQFICPEKNSDGRDKAFLTGGRTKGGYFYIPAADKGKTGPVCICEGFATAASLAEATGFAVVAAFSAGNLLPVGRLLRKKFPDRALIFAADNDTETAGNPGVTAATKAAAAVGAKLAVCPAHEGRATDFNDLHQWRSLEAVRAAMEGVLRDAAPSPGGARLPLRVIDIHEFLSLDVPPRKYLLHPVIPEQGLCMVFAERGVGKTFVALHVAYAVASGGSVFGWKAPSPAPVLYLDGEMPFSAMQERLASIVRHAENEPSTPSFLRILTPDLQGDNLMPNLGTPEGQAAVDPFLDGVKLVVVDNLATLARCGRSNEEESWIPIQGWLLSLRRRGISVLLVHHASKNGSQRGTSAKEDILDVSIQLRRPGDYEPEQGARFEVHLTKARGLFGEDAEPFEAALDGGTWNVRRLESVLADQLRELAGEGFTLREMAEETGRSRSAISRLCRKLGIKTKGARA